MCLFCSLIVNYYAVVFLLRPFEGKNACKSQENCVSAGGGGRGGATANLLRIVNFYYGVVFLARQGPLGKWNKLQGTNSQLLFFADFR